MDSLGKYFTSWDFIQVSAGCDLQFIIPQLYLISAIRQLFLYHYNYIPGI